MACKKCGMCCMTCDIIFEKITPESQEGVMDRLRWLNLHRCDCQIATKEDGFKYSMLRIPLTCTKLDHNKKTGEFFCKDYENRPILCRTYLCERAKKD